MAATAVILVLAAVAAVGATPASAGTGFYIRGGGYGNDIGMSQYGAAGYAEHGWSYQSILSHYYSGTTVAKLGSVKYVSVLLSQGAASFSGATTIRGSSVKLSSGTRYTVVRDGKLLELSYGGKLLKSAGKAMTFTAPLTVSGPAPLDLAGHGEYRGSLQFRLGGDSNACVSGSGGVATINLVGLNDYVRGVISAEMPSSWPEQALEVQAVAARTYAITSGSVYPGKYMLYASACSQMYEGVSAETPQTNSAVDHTYNRVVEYDGKPEVTYFSASSGGETKSIEYAWGISGEPWLQGVLDEYDDSYGNPYYSWEYDYSVAGAAGKLAGYLQGKLIGIDINANDAQVVGTGGSTTVDGADLQSIFGARSPNMRFVTMMVRPASAPKELYGTIFPAVSGARVTAQLKLSSGFKSVSAGKTNSTGQFMIKVRSAGTYRIVYTGIYGPRTTLK